MFSVLKFEKNRKVNTEKNYIEETKLDFYD